MKNYYLVTRREGKNKTQFIWADNNDLNVWAVSKKPTLFDNYDEAECLLKTIQAEQVSDIKFEIQELVLEDKK